MVHFALLLTLLITLFFNTPAFAQNMTHEQSLSLLLPKLSNLNKNASDLKHLAQKNYSFFEERYITPFSDLEKKRYTTFEELIQAFHNDPKPPIFNYEQTVEIANQYLDFTHPAFFYTIIIDLDKEPKILTKSMIEYSIGLLINIERLENTDLKHVLEIQQLKKIILKRVLLYADSSTYGAGLDSIDSKKLIYFYLMVNYFSNFPANLTYDLGQKLYGIISNQNTKLEKHEIYALSSLLFDLTINCYSNCSQPILTRQNALSSKDFYLKSLFEYSEQASKKRLINTRASSFYKYYLELLSRLNDPTYDDVKSSIIQMDFFGSIRQIPLDINQLWEVSTNKYGYFKIAITNFLRAIKLGILFSYNKLSEIQLWHWLYIIALGLLCFTGKNKITLKRVFGKSTLSNFNIPIKNAKTAVIKGDNLYHRIAINIFFIATTLMISGIKSSIEKYN